MRPLPDREFRRILLIKPSSPGDIIHALPVLRGLRRRFRQARLSWLVATPFADLLTAEPALDEVIPFDRKRFGRLGRDWAASAAFASFVSELNARRFDLVIDLQGLFRSGFLSLASGAPVRIGFAGARELAPVFYTHHIPASPPEAHAVDRNRQVEKLFGAPDAPADLRVSLTDADRASLPRLLADAGLPAGVNPVVLVPSTRWETKCWPAERFGLLARGLREATGAVCVLVGGASDQDAARIAQEAAGEAAWNLCGRTSLRQLAALVDAAPLVVTADSTPMHMAAGFGRPLVALFGPTNPRRTGPYGREADVLRLPKDCSPCYLKRLADCPHDHACLRDLSLDMVLQAALQRLQR